MQEINLTVYSWKILKQKDKTLHDLTQMIFSRPLEK